MAKETTKASPPATVDHDVLDERGDLLAAFSGGKPGNGDDGDRQLPMMTTHQTGMRTVGAQRVAVMRDEGKVLQKIKVLAAQMGEKFYYSFPVQNRKENRVDKIEGPSIKAAMAVLRYYGNCAAECYGVEDLGREWIFHARIVDYETGAELERPFRQRKSQKTIGTGDAERALDAIFQIGASKAIRNVIDGLLETFTEFAVTEAKSGLVEKIGKKIGAYRKRLHERIVDEEKLDPRRVENVIGRAIDDMLAPDIARVIAMVKTIEDSFSTWEEMFPPIVEPKTEGQGGAQAFAEGETREQKQAADAARLGGDPKTGELPAEATTTTSEALKASLAAGDAKPATDKPEQVAKDAPAEVSDAKTTPVDAPAPDLDGIHEAGAEAKAAGKSRAALPKEYRDPGHDAEANAWLDGFSGRPRASREPGEEG